MESMPVADRVIIDMPSVPNDVRQAERLIDEAIRGMAIWTSDRDALVRALLDVYRDSIEMLFLETGRQKLLAGHLENSEANLSPVLQMESRLHLGMFWALKWALAWSPVGGTPPPQPPHLLELIWTGATYQVFVDALWMHKHGWGRIAADLCSNKITVFEGGDRTGRDRDLAEHLHGTLALQRHDSFTEDDDQLTSGWTAGEYRALGNSLLRACEEACSESVVVTITDPPTELFKRPVVLEVPSGLVDEHADLVADLALTPEKLSAPHSLWKYNNWFDTPLVQVDGRYLCPSNILQAVFEPGVDEHMLRVASFLDPLQYSRVSQARELRMTRYCVEHLEAIGWSCTAPHPLFNPPADVDLHAIRADREMILELKSTIRPESLSARQN